METFSPVAPPERKPDFEPTKAKPRWNLFELFKKNEEQEKQSPESATKVREGQAIEAPEKPTAPEPRKKMAAGVLSLLRGGLATETSESEMALPTPQQPDRVIAPPTAPEFIPDHTFMVERARHVGRGAL